MGAPLMVKIGLGVVAASLFLAWSSLFVVDEREKALVIRFGQIQRAIDDPGLYFKFPLIEDLSVMEDRIVFAELLDRTVQVEDGRRYLVDAIAMLRIVDPILFRETVQANLLRAWTRIETRLEAGLRQTYGKRSFAAALSGDRSAMMREIRDSLRSQALSLGIEMVDVRIRRTDLLPEVLNDTYERMNAERFAEAAQLRAVGEAESRRIRAEADREAVEMISEAQREAEVVKGRADAERNRIFAESFSRDPEFFRFYRSMQAYAGSLSDSGTTFVLTPNSEFFEFFGSSP